MVLIGLFLRLGMLRRLLTPLSPRKLVEAVLEGKDARLGREVVATPVLLHSSYYTIMAEVATGELRVENAREVLEWARRTWEELKERKRGSRIRSMKQLTLAEVGVV
uniref:Uncharacterized protein n=1 Tax=Pyrococcus abyssi TaxID=29292 RepID=A0A5J6XTH7_PYRAY|nr:hypothetical protein [Pyrococcus abyssi]QFN51307.1 hypothetical protein [Pyrococcus abyssi]